MCGDVCSSRVLHGRLLHAWCMLPRIRYVSAWQEVPTPTSPAEGDEDDPEPASFVTRCAESPDSPSSHPTVVPEPLSKLSRR